MNQAANLTARIQREIFTRWAAVAALALIPSVCPAQLQQTGSLADAARHVRSQSPQSEGDAGQAQQVADELSEDQNHNDSAPGGFKTYKAGDYSLYVPAPYTLGGHDDAGIVLVGPVVGFKQSLVLVGNPILLAPGAGDDAFRDSASQFAHLYSQTANCSKASLGSHNAYQCSLAAANLTGQRVSGNAWFVRSSNTVYPVFCAAPTDSGNRDYINNPKAYSTLKENARRGLDREEEYVRQIWQKCDTVFQSIRIKEGDAQQAAAPEAQPKSGKSSSAGATASTGGPSSETARVPKPAAVNSLANTASESTLPGGLKAQPFQYCAAVNQCWDASVMVPSEAKLINSDCGQYAYELKIKGSPFLLLAGSAGIGCEGRNASDANLVRWKELVDPDNKRAPGTSSTISAMAGKLDGKPANIITLGFRKGLTEWMAKRAEVDSNGLQVVVGCIAPRDHFDDGDAICSALIDSLRLP